MHPTRRHEKPRPSALSLVALGLGVGIVALGCGVAPRIEPPAGTPDGGTSLAITAPNEDWTWVPFGDAFCANGAPTGLALNVTDRSPNLVIFFMGGGACWDYPSCYMNPQASYVGTGFGETDMPFLTLVAGTMGLAGTREAGSTFRDYSVAALPYCTGDAFTGSRTVDYNGQTTMHVGHDNVLAYLRRLVPTFPNAKRVIVLGVSAGGIGVGLNWWYVQQAFGDVRVDMIDDSGPPLPPPYMTPTIDKRWRTAWALDKTLPPGCAGCKTDLSALIDWEATEMPKSRGALLSYTHDSVLPDFMEITSATFALGLDALGKKRIDGHANFHYFFEDDSSHVLLPHRDLQQGGVRLWSWVDQMVNDDAGWTSVKP